MKSVVKQTPLPSSRKGNDGTNRELARGGGDGATMSRAVTFCDEIQFDDGTRVLVHRLIDQGEFRCIYMGRNVQTHQLYALKKVDCRDPDQAEQCRKEVTLHRLFHHENIMPLLGVKFVQEFVPSPSKMICYMLFPFLPHSLRDDITKRRLLEDTLESKRRPYSQSEALTLFAGIVSAVKTIHEAGFSHRDIRVENVLLQQKKEGHRKRRDIGTPVLTDFGSVGPVNAALPSFSHVLRAMEAAERYTTAAYRAPELFGGGLSYGPSESLHYDYADVWSLGCLLFAILYGTSPFEMEWGVSLVEGAAAEGTVRFVGGESTRQKVLAPIPFPPCGSAADRRYGENIKDLIRWMLKRNGCERPSIGQVVDQIEILLDGKDKTGKSQ